MGPNHSGPSGNVGLPSLTTDPGTEFKPTVQGTKEEKENRRLEVNEWEEVYQIEEMKED